MPHLLVEYSSNLTLDVDALLDALHTAAGSLACLPLAGLRTRGVPRDQFRVADRHPDNAFVSITVRLSRGRSEEEKKTVGDMLFATLKAAVAAECPDAPLSLALEIQEIEPESRWRAGTIREHLGRRAEDDHGG